MKQSILSSTIAVVACFTFASSSSHAVEVFAATPANTTGVTNQTNPLPTISGATPDLFVTHGNANNNNMSGFASTDDIDTFTDSTPLPNKAFFILEEAP